MRKYLGSVCGRSIGPGGEQRTLDLRGESSVRSRFHPCGCAMAAAGEEEEEEVVIFRGHDLFRYRGRPSAVIFRGEFLSTLFGRN